MAKSDKAERTTFAAEADELSLAESVPDAADAAPDTLDVRDDSLMVMHGALQRLRRPAVAVVVGLAISVAALAVAGALARGNRPRVDRT